MIFSKEKIWLGTLSAVMLPEIPIIVIMDYAIAAATVTKAEIINV
jgi:hypothetical protein